jgi:hypothetical protein
LVAGVVIATVGGIRIGIIELTHCGVGLLLSQTLIPIASVPE